MFINKALSPYMTIFNCVFGIEFSAIRFSDLCTYNCKIYYVNGLSFCFEPITPVADPDYNSFRYFVYTHTLNMYIAVD